MFSQRILLLLFCWSTFYSLFAQCSDSIEIVAYKLDDNLYQFDIDCLPEEPLQNCPTIPFEDRFIYFWTFGDGSYSFEKNPIHFFEDEAVQSSFSENNKQAKSSSFSRTIRVEVTAIYDDDDIFEDERIINDGVFPPPLNPDYQ